MKYKLSLQVQQSR